MNPIMPNYFINVNRWILYTIIKQMNLCLIFMIKFDIVKYFFYFQLTTSDYGNNISNTVQNSLNTESMIWT